MSGLNPSDHDLLHEKLSWKHHIAYVCSRIARNIGIFTKLRHYMPLAQLKQLYYSLVHPYISYAILAWGSGSRTQIKKVQTKQNTVVRTIFFATSHGKNTESALPLMNLHEILSVTSILKMQALKFAHGWHDKALPNIFDNYFQYCIYPCISRTFFHEKLLPKRGCGLSKETLEKTSREDT